MNPNTSAAVKLSIVIRISVFGVTSKICKRPDGSFLASLGEEIRIIGDRDRNSLQSPRLAEPDILVRYRFARIVPAPRPRAGRGLSSSLLLLIERSPCGRVEGPLHLWGCRAADSSLQYRKSECQQTEQSYSNSSPTAASTRAKRLSDRISPSTAETSSFTGRSAARCGTCSRTSDAAAFVPLPGSRSSSTKSSA